jgi:hypothetical protein
MAAVNILGSWIYLFFSTCSPEYEPGLRRPEVAHEEKITCDPATISDGENRGFLTGCPVFTDLWSYVLILVCNIL